MKIIESKMDEQMKGNNVLIKYRSGNFTTHNLPDPKKMLDAIGRKSKFIVFGNLAFNER